MAGRQLAQMAKENVSVEFAYDHNGLRTQKIVTKDGVTTATDYTLHGKLITHLTQGNDNLHFYYDANSRPAMVDFNGTMYTYIHNLQGDIVAILDSAGNIVVEYKYDAWGKPISTTGSKSTTLGKLNPFRYRGYVYDEETGLYYLRSRYYAPVFGRFINADVTGILIADFMGVVDKNLFAYCENNPVMDADPSGLWSWKSFGKMALATLGMIGCTFMTAATFGTVPAVFVGATLLWNAIDGALSARASGGDMGNGYFAGACGGIVSCMFGLPSQLWGMASDSALRYGVTGRAGGSMAYNLIYEWLQTGTLDPNNLLFYSFDVAMDAIFSCIGYEYMGSVTPEMLATLRNSCLSGLYDAVVDIFQSAHMTPPSTSSESKGGSKGKKLVPSWKPARRTSKGRFSGPIAVIQ